MTLSLYNSQSLKDRRKELRKNQTEAEKLLWDRIKNKKLDAYKFFRQYSIGPYILDFYCPLLRLAVELDGDYHTESDVKIYDKEREVFLKDKFVRTIRFWNNEVLNNIESVLQNIKKEMVLKDKSENDNT